MSPRTLPCVAATCLALAAWILPAARAEGDGEELPRAGPVHALSPAALGLAQTLRRARSEPQVPTVVRVDELEPLGRSLIPAALMLLERERVPALEPEEGEQSLSVPQREIVLAALQRRPPRAVISALDDRLALALDRAGRLLALRVLGAVGDASCLDRLAALAMLGQEEQPPQGLEPALRESLARILAREPKGFDSLPRLLRTSPGPLRSAVLEAAGDTGQPRAIEVFTYALLLSEDLAPLVAAQVPRVGRSTDPIANSELVERLRVLLDSQQPAARRAVVLALGELRDDDSIPTLILLLESEDQGLAQNALWALQRCTGLSFPASAERWRQWHAQERAWFAHEELAVLRDLASRDAAKVSEALREISRRRTQRNELAFEVLEVLQRPEPSLRAQACETLGSLGSTVALPALLERLESDIPFCTQKAWQALCAITGRDLPAEPDAWRRTLALDA